MYTLDTPGKTDPCVTQSYLEILREKQLATERVRTELRDQMVDQLAALLFLR